jgi:beta-lactamase regulating signal transducer with metallopeptidase domain
MTTALDVLENAFFAVLDASIAGGVLVLVIGITLRIARRSISARWKHAIWLLAAARLCLPGTLPSPVPLPGMLRWQSSRPKSSEVVFVGFCGAALDEVDVQPVSGTLPASGPSLSVAAVTPSAEVERSTGARFHAGIWLAGIWFAGMLLAVARVVVAHVRDRRRFRDLSPAADVRLDDVLKDCAARLRLRHSPQVRCSAGVVVPCVAGILRPRILLPRDGLSACSRDELRHVFLHELAHIQRRDAAVNSLLAVVQAVHWFNPLAHWAIGRVREEREMACDELVLRHAGDGSGQAYASTLVGLVESASRRLAPTASLGLEGGRVIERRIRWALGASTRKTSHLLAAVLLAGCALAGLSCTRDSRAEPFQRIYDVGVLLEPVQDFAAPRLGVLTLDALPKAPPVDPEAARQERMRKLEELGALVRARVEPESWGNDSRMEFQDGQLIVTAREAVQQGVKALLDQRFAERGLAVTVTCKLLALDPESKGSLGGELPAAIQAALAREPRNAARQLSPEELAEVTGTARQVSAPSLTVYNRQRSHSLVVQQSSIIADVRTSEVNGEEVLDPVPGTLNTGFVVEVRPELNADTRRAALDLAYEWADARRPIQAFRVFNIPIAAPEVSMAHSRVSLDAPLGSWLLADAFEPTIPQKETMLILVRVDLVPGSGGSNRR